MEKGTVGLAPGRRRVLAMLVGSLADAALAQVDQRDRSLPADANQRVVGHVSLEVKRFNRWQAAERSDVVVGEPVRFTLRTNVFAHVSIWYRKGDSTEKLWPKSDYLISPGATHMVPTGMFHFSEARPELLTLRVDRAQLTGVTARAVVLQDNDPAGRYFWSDVEAGRAEAVFNIQVKPRE